MAKYRWLQNKNDKAFCTACDKPILNNLAHIERHSKKGTHKRNFETKSNQVRLEKCTCVEKKKLTEQVRDDEYSLIMFCVMHNLPFLLMDFLPNLLRVCCPDSKIAKEIKCGRTKATDLTEKLALKSKKNIVNSLINRKFSLIIDETTDVSCRKAMVLVARYFDHITNAVKDKFLGLIELDKCDSESIYKAVTSFLSIHNIPIKNLIGLATDGASTMAGHLTGLKAKLSRDTNLFYMKCTCHSLHLCASYASKKLPHDVETLCRNIYSYFSWSPKRVHELKEFQEYCHVKPHKVLGVAMTRWLSLEQAILRMIEQWDALKLYFLSQTLEINDIRPKELASLMAIQENKAYMLFLSYVLKIVNDINIEFQSEHIRHHLYNRLESTVKLLLNNFARHDYVTSKSLSTVNFIDSKFFLPLEEVFIGVKAQQYIETHGLDQLQINKIKEDALEFYIELVNQMLRRFDFSRDDIKCLEIITPIKVLSDEEISILPLLSHFSHLTDCEPDVIVTQWTMLRLSNNQIKHVDDMCVFWEQVKRLLNGLNDPAFNELTSFIFNLLSLPHSSAAAERKFFEMSLIKTKLRNKLEFKTVNNVMLCKELCANQDGHYVWSPKDIKTTY